MKYKLVIFDFDGTLANSFPWFLTIVDDLADKFKFKRVDRNNLAALRGFDVASILKQHNIPLWKMPQIGEYIKKLLVEDIHKVPLFAGIDQLLKRLSEAGVKIALVTSNSYKIARQVLGPANTAVIDDYECGVDLFGKSDKFKRILRRCNTSAADAICIGDEIRDLQAARTAGIAFGAVSWGYASPEVLQSYFPDELFTCVEEIGDKILS